MKEQMKKVGNQGSVLYGMGFLGVSIFHQSCSEFLGRRLGCDQSHILAGVCYLQNARVTETLTQCIRMKQSK
jgi:hypothetical protein